MLPSIQMAGRLFCINRDATVILMVSNPDPVHTFTEAAYLFPRVDRYTIYQPRDLFDWLVHVIGQPMFNSINATADQERSGILGYIYIDAMTVLPIFH